MKLRKPGSILSRSAIESFEREIGGKLPEDYKQFLLTFNGGIPDPTVGIKWEGEVEEVAAFYELDRRHDKGLRYVYSEMRNSSTDGLLPIACTFNHQRICLDVLKNPGFVYVTVCIDECDISASCSTACLADSFTEFLNDLVEIPAVYCPIEALGRSGTSEDLMEFLSEGHSVNDRGKNELTIVSEAIKFDNVPMVQACIDARANLSGTIYVAVQNYRIDLIKKLIECGADVNERNEYGKTPLRYVGGTALPGAEGARNREMRELLLKLGAVE